MGKGKKKFIEKDEGQHYHLVHRSQTDEAYAKEENPSQFVLVPSGKNSTTFKANDVTTLFQTKSSINDHINSLGFKNDGYDYSQHIKVIHGGSYVNKEGKVVERIAAELPDEVFGSEKELDRQLHAITISEEYMDEDIKQALFDETDDNGESFEVLDDDFVLQIAEEPEVPDFDFDAHMAQLIALSERSLNGGDAVNGPRGWDDPSLKGGKFLKRKQKTKYNKYDDDYHSEDDDEDDEEGENRQYNHILHRIDENERSHEEGEGDGNEEYEDDLSDIDNYEHHHGGGGANYHRKGNYHNKEGEDENEEDEGEEDFEKLLEQYDDDHLGYIDNEEEEAEVVGTIDISTENNTHFNDALNEYLLECKDIQLYEGVTEEMVKANKLKMAQFRSYIPDNTTITTSAATTTTTTTNNNNNVIDGKQQNAVDYKKEYQEQVEYQQECSSLYPQYTNTTSNIRKGLTEFDGVIASDIDKGILDTEDVIQDIIQSQDYLKNITVRDEWDCETILTTYSTLDNHPTIIKDPKSKFKPYISKYTKNQQRQQQLTEHVSSMQSLAGRQHTSTTTTIGNQIPSSSAASVMSSTTMKTYNTLVSRNKGTTMDYTNVLKNSYMNIKGIQNNKTQDHSRLQGILNAANMNLNPTTSTTTTTNAINATTAIITDKENSGDHHSSIQHDELLEEHEHVNENDSDSENDTVVDEDEDEAADTNSTVPGQGHGRNKTETKEEKRLRKQQVKEERRLKRIQKKELKVLHKQEYMKLHPNTSNNGSKLDKLAVYKYAS